MYEKLTLILLAIIGVFILYLTFRGRSNRSGIQDSKGSIDNIERGTTGLQESNKRVESGLEQLSENLGNAEGRVDHIEENLGNAERGIESALGILERAKDR